MNTGQSMLTLGAIMIFGIIILRVNTHTLNVTDEVDDSRYGILALALARSRIDAAQGLKFDEKSIYNNVLPDVNGNPTSSTLTASGSLGPDAGENAATYDDFDDFNGLTAVVDTLPSTEYTVSSRVQYVDAKNGYVTTSSVQWHKMITVTVTSPRLRNPVVQRAINSYWTY